MGWGEIIKAAIIALPKIVDEFKALRLEIKAMQNAATDRRIDEIQREVSEIITKVKHEEDRQKLLDLVRDLNRSVSK